MTRVLLTMSREEISAALRLAELPPVQRTILDAIRAGMRDHGRPPTLRELAVKVFLSKAGVAYNLRLLERAGFVEWTRRVARGIRVLDGAP